MRVQRRRHADRDEVHVLHKAEVGGCRQRSRLHQLFQIAVHHVPDVVVSGVHQLHLFRLHVESDGLEPGLRLLHRQRQPHIAEAYHPDHDFPALNLFQ